MFGNEVRESGPVFRSSQPESFFDHSNLLEN